MRLVGISGFKQCDSPSSKLQTQLEGLRGFQIFKAHDKNSWGDMTCWGQNYLAKDC